MFVIIGFVVVFGSLIGGFLLEHGNLLTLMQFQEFLIIGGAAFGSLLISNPLSLTMKVIKGVIGTLKGSPLNKESYLDLLSMLYELFQFAKREGLIALEQHIENPESSSIMSKFPTFLNNHHAVSFLCDTLKVVLSGGVPAHDLEDLMDLDIDTMHHEESQPAAALNVVADAFPGLGIVAAVMGVVITMGKISEGPEEVGASVAAALVGTFLGVLLSYGIVGPLSRNMGFLAEAEGQYVLVVKSALLSFAKGMPAAVAIEYGRRAIAPEHRPTFKETEEASKKARS